MFTSRLVTLAFVLIFAIVNVMAIPVPGHFRLGLAAAGPRDASPFEPIPAYMKRDAVWESDYAKRGLDGIPEQIAARAPVGTTAGDIPDDVPVKSADDGSGDVVPF